MWQIKFREWNLGDGIEVRFNALILWEILSLHDIIQSLMIPIFLLALSDSVFVLFVFVLNPTGKFICIKS